MNSYIKQAVTLAVSAIIAAIPATTLAVDSNIASVAVNPTSTTAGASTSYSLTMVPAVTSSLGTDSIISLLVAEVEDGNPSNSGFDFSSTTYGPAIGISANGSVYGGGIGYQLTLTNDTVSPSVSVGLSNVMNSETAGCYYALVTTESPEEGANFTYSDIFSIGGTDCSDVEEIDDGMDDEDEEQGDSSALNVEVAAMGDHIGVSWDAVDSTADDLRYELLYTSTPEDDFVEGGNPDRVNSLTGTEYVLADLELDTEYHFILQAFDGGDQLESSDTLAATTGSKTLEKTRLVKPAPTAKKIKKKKFRVKLTDEVEGTEFFTRYKVQVARKNGKQKKTYKLGAAKRNRDIKKLKPGKNYKVRVKAVVDVNGENVKSRWSKWTKFTTKEEVEETTQ